MESQPVRRPQTQAWLRTIYDRPSEFLGQTVAILNDEEILLTASTFRDAREEVAKLGLRAGANVAYFHVPHSLPEVCILTLRVRSLKESLWDVFDAFFIEFRQTEKKVVFTPTKTKQTSA